MSRQMSKKNFDLSFLSPIYQDLNLKKCAPPKELVRVFGNCRLVTSSQEFVKSKKRTYSEI